MTTRPMTWDQAHILGLATARGFSALNIPASTVRRWAHEGRITAAGKAPGGAHLYPIDDVTRTAANLNHQPTHRASA